MHWPSRRKQKSILHPSSSPLLDKNNERQRALLWRRHFLPKYVSLCLYCLRCVCTMERMAQETLCPSLLSCYSICLWQTRKKTHKNMLGLTLWQILIHSCCFPTLKLLCTSTGTKAWGPPSACEILLYIRTLLALPLADANRPTKGCLELPSSSRRWCLARTGEGISELQVCAVTPWRSATFCNFFV